MLTALCVLLHNLYLVPTPSAWTDFWRVLVIYTLYIGVSWLILLVWFNKVQKVHLGVFFSALRYHPSSSWPFIIPAERKAGSFSY